LEKLNKELERKYIISHDVGTQSNKAVLIDPNGKVLGSEEMKYGLHLPRPGWAEQRPEDYWNSITTTTKDLLQKLNIKPKEIAAMVFSTQAMGIIPVNENGEVLHPNISWVDGRAENEAIKLMGRLGGKTVFKALVGIKLTGKDVIPKLMWLKSKKSEIYNQTHKFLDVNGFLKFKCTNRMVAEWSGACSYAFNLKKKDWERIFFKIAGIDLKKLPELVKSTDLIGHLTPKAAMELGLDEQVAIFGGCDDTQSAAMGSGQIAEGGAHIYLGTSAWIGVSTKRNLKFKHGAVCLQSADPSSNFVVGITESAGANIEWLLKHFYSQEHKDGLNVYELMEKELEEVPAGSDGLLFTPWFLGERCPVSTTTTRATILNLGFEHSRNHIMHAQLEGIGYNLKWALSNIQKDFGFRIDEISVIGGGSQNSAWMQALADILNIRIKTTDQPKMAGAIGCAMTAIVGLGLANDFSAITKFSAENKRFEPQQKNWEVYGKMYRIYRKTYSDLKNIYRKANYTRFNS